MTYIAIAILLLLFVIFLILRVFFNKSQKRLLETLKSLSFDVMQANNKTFLDLAKSVLGTYQEQAKGQFDVKQKEMQAVIEPLKASLEKADKYIRELEKQREGAYVSLSKQIQTLAQAEQDLRLETANLSKALRSPNIRGSWGQVHLRRVVELSGMLNQCDFFEQKSSFQNDKTLRPDLVVRLPGDRQIIIDAKTPISAYLEASEQEDGDVKKQKLKQHALHLRRHIKELSEKQYWHQFTPTPEYVILFLPAEAFFSAALNEDPALLEEGASQNIIIATPTTLIAILKAVAYGWKQESMSKSAKEIAQIGQELYERLFIMKNHFSKVGKSLSQSVDAYNQAISSLEARVLVSARKLKEMGMRSSKETLSLEEITKTTRSLDLSRNEP